jgi:GNAT superfamily N-acetyltransferase
MLETLRYKLRHYPLPRLIMNAMKRAGITIIPYYFCAYSTDYRRPANESRQYRLVELGPDDMPRVAALPMSHSTEETYRGRLRLGHRCHGLLLGDQLVAYSWLDPVRCSYGGEGFALAPGEVYAYDLFTAPGERGRDLAPLLIACRNELLRANGIRTVCTVVDYFNHPSLAVGKKVGSRRKRLNLYIRIFGLVETSLVLKTFPP